MPLRPPRRLPRAFQRRASPLSRLAAQRYAGRRRRPAVFPVFVNLARQWRRLSRGAGRVFTRLGFACACAFGLSIVVAAFFFLFSPAFSVSSIRVSRPDRRVDVEEIQKLLRPFFGRHILSLSSLHVEQVLRSAFPEVSSVRVNRNMPGELHVTLSLDPIAADVVLGDPDDTETDLGAGQAAEETERRPAPEIPYRFLTSRGIYLEYPFPLVTGQPSPPAHSSKAIVSSQDDRMVLHLVDWAAKPVHRQRLFPEEVLREIGNVRRILRESFGQEALSVTFYLRAREFHIRTREHILWFDLASPSVAQLNRYRSFLRTLGHGNAGGYVDLRLHDRVVYR